MGFGLYAYTHSTVHISYTMFLFWLTFTVKNRMKIAVSLKAN